MGNIFSKKKYCRIDAKKLEETPFSYYTEVSSTLRKTQIESVTDETCGSASNLLKVEEPSNEFSSIQEESRDGWIVKRHIDIASVTVRLCEATYIFGFDIDTTGFENICPTHARIEGLKTPIEDNNEEWITLVDTESITPNAHNFFQKNNNDEVLYSHVRLTISPGGGIARFRTYGDIVPCYLNPETEYNLASASLGARIVRWSDTDSSNEPNVLLDKGTLSTHGWLTPRSRKTERNDFIVIQLAMSSSLNSIIIDTTGFKGNSPLKVRIEGCNSKEDDPYLDVYTQWFSLVPESSIKEDALNTFEVPYTDTVSHVRLTLLPDGGLQQIKCLGTISNDLMLQYDSAKSLTSTALNEEESMTLINTAGETSTSEEKLNSDTETREASISSAQEESSPVADTEGLDPNRPAISYLGVCNNIPMTPSSSQEPNYIQPSSQECKQTPSTFQVSNHTPPASQTPSRASSLEEIEEKNKKTVHSSTIIEKKSTMETLPVCKDKYTPIAPRPVNANDSSTPMEIIEERNKRKAEDDNNASEHKIPRRTKVTDHSSIPRYSDLNRTPSRINLDSNTIYNGPALAKRGRGRPRKNKD